MLLSSHFWPRQVLRIGEALGVKATDFGPNCRVLHVRRNIWRGKEPQPKTPYAVRVIDIPEVLARELRDYLSDVSDYLFATVQGKPLQQRNVLRILHRSRPVGFHVFRRFRMTRLRKLAVPRDLELLWMGHAPEEVGDLYSKLNDDTLVRPEWAERVGLGFQLIHFGTQNKLTSETPNVA